MAVVRSDSVGWWLDHLSYINQAYRCCHHGPRPRRYVFRAEYFDIERPHIADSGTAGGVEPAGEDPQPKGRKRKRKIQEPNRGEVEAREYHGQVSLAIRDGTRKLVEQCTEGEGRTGEGHNELGEGHIESREGEGEGRTGEEGRTEAGEGEGEGRAEGEGRSGEGEGRLGEGRSEAGEGREGEGRTGEGHNELGEGHIESREGEGEGRTGEEGRTEAGEGEGRTGEGHIESREGEGEGEGEGRTGEEGRTEAGEGEGEGRTGEGRSEEGEGEGRTGEGRSEAGEGEGEGRTGEGRSEAGKGEGRTDTGAPGVGHGTKTRPASAIGSSMLAELCSMAKRMAEEQHRPVQVISLEAGTATGLDLLARLTQNATDCARIVTLMGHRYLLPPRCTFLLSDISGLGALVGRGKYDVITLDPPWENKSVKRSGGYSHLFPWQIRQIPVPSLAAPGCLVASWVTNRQRHRRFVREELYPGWSVQVVAEWHWVKVTRHGEFVVPLDSAHKKPYEILVLGRYKGSPEWAEGEPVTATLPVPDRKLMVSVPCALHSHKPPLGEVLKGLTGPHPQCLELFARNLQPGWTSWGNEVLKFQHLDYFQELDPEEGDGNCSRTQETGAGGDHSAPRACSAIR